MRKPGIFLTGIFLTGTILLCNRIPPSLNYPQNLVVDAVEIIPTVMKPVEESTQYIQQKTALAVSPSKTRCSTADSFELPFFLRDTVLLPKVCSRYLGSSMHPYYKIRALNALSSLGDRNFCSLVTPLLHDSNDLIREYAVIAAGVICSECYIDTLQSLLKNEQNGYIKKTVEYSCMRIKDNTYTGTVSDNLDTSFKLPTEPFFKQSTESKALAWETTIFPESANIPLAQKFIYPHQQYKLMNDRQYYHKISFGIEMLPKLIHVGEDSGWELPGMPIHAITDGVVVRVMYEQTWGNLIAIESRLPEGKCISHFYGHLSEEVGVAIGDYVTCGQFIGTIGSPMSRENGGYRPHLHLGIAKGRLKDTGTIGYYHRTDAWYNPVSFLYLMSNVRRNRDAKKTGNYRKT